MSESWDVGAIVFALSPPDSPGLRDGLIAFSEMVGFCWVDVGLVAGVSELEVDCCTDLNVVEIVALVGVGW